MWWLDSYRDKPDCGTLSAVNRSLTVQAEATGANCISARIETPAGAEIRVTTESNYSLDHSVNPWLTPLLAAGMRHRWDVDFDAPVDSVALRNASKAQSVLRSRYPRRFHKI